LWPEIKPIGSSYRIQWPVIVMVGMSLVTDRFSMMKDSNIGWRVGCLMLFYQLQLFGDESDDLMTGLYVCMLKEGLEREQMCHIHREYRKPLFLWSD
jgi:hypothetical protein